MSDHIQRLSAQLAADPDSLVFLELGDALRRAGQLEAALSVARAGLERHPRLADAHDLLARIAADHGDARGAFQAWSAALELAPGHGPAHKGIAYLHYRAGDLVNARRHLEAAAKALPGDPGVRAALARLERSGSRAEPMPQAPGAAGPDAFETALDGDVVLFDIKGLRLAGTLEDGDARAADTVAALFAPVAREAARTSRLLGLGVWTGLGIESPDATVHLSPPTDDALLAVFRPSAVTVGRAAVEARQLGTLARRWLEGGR